MGVLFAKYNNEVDYDNDSSSADDSEFGDPPTPQSDDVIDNICFDSATDAVHAAPSMPIRLTLDNVMLIENSLDTYEKVSLIYLLCDDAAPTLSQLELLVGGHDHKFIYNWAIHQNLRNKKWQEKLVEALCIIQNYEILKMMGFNKDHLNLVFVPHHSFTYIHISKIRKALYFLCEGFDQNDVTTLLNLIWRDFSQKGFTFKIHNNQFLELYLLHWESIGYIQHDNLTNLCGVLKQMDLLDLCDNLKQLTPSPVVTATTKVVEKSSSFDGNFKANTVFDEIMNPNLSLLQLASHISADNAAFVSADNKYEIDAAKPGVCLIINQEDFYREIDPALQHLLPPVETKLDSRKGTEHDKKELRATFEQFGFRTVTVDNLIHSDIPSKIEEVIKTITDESSFFVCIMSHGDEGVVYGVNSCKVSVKTLKNIMVSKNRTNLSGKPKVLILQSCQGTRCQRISSVEEDEDMATDGPSSGSSEPIPRCVDLFTFWATVPGFGAIRNKKTGSWFIQSLCENMRVFRDKHHFEDICTQVICDVSGKKWKHVKEELAMVPQKDSTFRKLLYLPPLRS